MQKETLSCRGNVLCNTRSEIFSDMPPYTLLSQETCQLGKKAVQAISMHKCRGNSLYSFLALSQTWKNFPVTGDISTFLPCGR